MSNHKSDNSGVLFKNTRKTSEKHPTHTGKITAGGVEYYMSAWVKEKRDNSGEKYFSISLTEVLVDNKSAPAETTNFDDDVPF